MATVTGNEAIGRHIEALKAEALIGIAPGGTALDDCDWNSSGANSGDVERELRAHVSRTHGFDIDALKPDLRERVLAAITG